MEHKHPKHPELHLASFSERVVAFMIDAAPFAAGYLLSLRAFFPGEALWANPNSQYWAPLWGAAFIIYQAYSSCEGRRSLGKSLLGLRVVSLESEPLHLGGALMRSLLYPLSSIFSLGFLWSLFNPTRQCWHDLAVGSMVTTERVRSSEGLALVRAGALASVAGLSVLTLWNKVYEPRYERVMTVAYAHVGLNEIAKLEQIYHRRHGRYAEDLIDLAPVSAAPAAFMRDMSRLFDPEAGVRIQANRGGYTVIARARDSARTQVSFKGS